MEKQMLSIDFDLKFEEIQEINSSFAFGRVGIAYTGRNRNKSDISKDSFEKAAKSLKNIPIVGRYDSATNTFGGHDIAVTSDKDGNLSIINATTPFGLVPESAIQTWEEVEEEDGTKREYLFTSCILWKRQHGYEYLSTQKKLGQSMEIFVKKYEIDKDGYCVIEDFEYEALCILGEGIEPCFESANVQLFSKKATSNYKSQFSQMIEELKELTKEQSINLDFSNKNPIKEGGEQMDKELINSILLEFSVALEDLNFEITEDITEVDFRTKLEEFAKSKEELTFSATYRQKKEAIDNALDPIVIKDENGDIISETYFWSFDFDDTYAFVDKHFWSKDNNEKEVGRFKYSFDEATITATIDSEFEKMVKVLLTMDEYAKVEEARKSYELLKTDFDKYKEEYSTPNSEVETLKTFQDEVVKEKHKLEVEEVLGEFEDLSENEEFNLLKAKALEFTSIEELQKECYIIRGKNAPVKAFSKQSKPKTIKLPVEMSQSDKDDLYGGLFSKYNND